MKFATLLLCISALCSASSVSTYEVVPAFETEAVPHMGDAADDIAIWINPEDHSKSVIFGSDKKGGIIRFDWNGRALSYNEVGNINNIDIRQNIETRDGTKDILVGTNRTNNTLAVFEIDRRDGSMTFLDEQPAGVEVYGVCMFTSEEGKLYAFVVGKSGKVEQWRVTSPRKRDASFKLVKTFAVRTQAEGCVVDDETHTLYLAEEEHGIWKLDARADEAPDMALIDRVGTKSLTADIEGLALYKKDDGTGYLVASSQGNSTFAVYERQGDNRFVRSIALVAGKGIDAVTGTDGIEISSMNFGGDFSRGVFISQDDENETNQNFKVVPWSEIQKGL